MTSFAHRFTEPRGARDIAIRDRMYHVVLQRLLGTRPKDIAAMMGVSLHVVRTDLKRVGWSVADRSHWQYGGFVAWTRRLDVLGIPLEVIEEAGALNCPDVGWHQSADMPSEPSEAWLRKRRQASLRACRRRAWWARRRERAAREAGAQ